MNERSKKTLTASPIARRQSGRVTFDERGNSVWQWKNRSGEYDSHISTQQLKKLEVRDLKLEDEASSERGSGCSSRALSHTVSPSRDMDPEDRGMNPYHSDRLIKSQNARGYTHPALANRSVNKRPANPSLVSKYGHTIKNKSNSPLQGIIDKFKSIFDGKR